MQAYRFGWLVFDHFFPGELAISTRGVSCELSTRCGMYLGSLLQLLLGPFPQSLSYSFFFWLLYHFHPNNV